MTMSPTFQLSHSARDQYRKLVYNPDAPFLWSYIPLSSVFWQDEHSEEFWSDMDETSRFSIMNLAEARTRLWLDGEIPADLRSVWEEAKLVLPEWPGFRRLTVTDAEREAIASFRKMLDDFEDEMFAEADAASKIIDEAGISHVQMMFHTDKPKDK